MRTQQWFAATILFVVSVLATQGVLAQGAKVWISAGLKGTIGGNQITEPSDKEIYTPDFEQDVPLLFMDGAGGTGGGGGVFGEIRILRQYLGLEVDLLFDANKTWYAVDDPSGAELDYVLKYRLLRVPVLLKANVKIGATRFGFGIGPEFLFGLKADTDIEVTENDERLPASELAEMKSALFVRKRNDKALTWAVALAFEAREFEITLDLRISHILTWPREYDDRVEITTPDQNVFYKFDAGHAVDGRIMLGVAYVFSR